MPRILHQTNYGGISDFKHFFGISAFSCMDLRIVSLHPPHASLQFASCFHLNMAPEQSEDQQCGGCEEVRVFHLFFNCYYFINVSFAACLTWILKTRFVQTFFRRGF